MGQGGKPARNILSRSCVAPADVEHVVEQPLDLFGLSVELRHQVLETHHPKLSIYQTGE
jgi:hypothetical protein